VKYFEQLPQSQKFSIALLGLGKPKNLPPSRRIRVLEHCGLAHFEIIFGYSVGYVFRRKFIVLCRLQSQAADFAGNAFLTLL
jgi:hypothetical protein